MSTRATSRPNHGSRRSTKRTKWSAMPTSARNTTSSDRTGRCTSRRNAPAAVRADSIRPSGTRISVAAAHVPQGSYRTVTPEEMQDLFGNEDPFSDFFHAFFSGGDEPQMRGRRGGGARASHARQGRDVEHPLDLSLEDAYRGTTRRLSLERDGTARTVDVRIPAGVGEGSRVRVSGEGEQGAGGATSGDLYLRVHMSPDARFERKGQDLHAKVRVPVTTAVLGGEADVAESVREANPSPNSSRHPERAGFSSSGQRDAACGQAERVWRPLCNGRRRTPARTDAGGAQPLRGARQACGG